MLRLQPAPCLPTSPGWLPLCTPMGALAHVEVNSTAWELCEDWRMLASGRMHFVSRENFAHWFGSPMAEVPVGLATELLWANNMKDLAMTLLAAEPAARVYVLSLPDSCFGLDEEEWLHLGELLDLARCLETRIAARAAAREALDGN